MRGSKGYLNQSTTNKLSVNPDIENIVQRRWSLESNGTYETESIFDNDGRRT